MAIVIRPRTPKSAPEAKIERTEAPTTQEVGMKKCKLCEEEHPAKSFKKYEGVEMCEECYIIEKEGLEDEKEEGWKPRVFEPDTPEKMKEVGDMLKKVLKSKKEKPVKEVVVKKKEEPKAKVKSSGKAVGKVYTRVVEWQGTYGPPQKMFLIATDPSFFEEGSKIKPLALGGFKAHLIAQMMKGEVEGPTIFEYVEKHATKYAGGK